MAAYCQYLALHVLINIAHVHDDDHKKHTWIKILSWDIPLKPIIQFTRLGSHTYPYTGCLPSKQEDIEEKAASKFIENIFRVNC